MSLSVKDSTGATKTIKTALDGSDHVSVHDIQAVRTYVRTAISASSSGDNTLLAGSASTKIKVVAIYLVAAGSVSAKFKTGSTDLTGAMPLAANGQLMLPPALPGYHHLECGTAEDFKVNLSGAVAVTGWMITIKE